MEWIVFGILAVCAVASAVGLVTRPNPLYAAMFLVANLFCVAALYLTLRAEFLALAQVIVYAGAIMVLFIFAIYVLVPRRAESGPDPLWSQRLLALPFGGLLGLVVILVIAQGGAEQRVAVGPGDVASLGRLLLTDYLFPFEVTSVLLLAALIGALTLAKRRSE